MIATKIIAGYAQYGLVPTVIPPKVIDPPIPIERTPVQQGTDLEYLEQMAERHGYVFYVTPGPAPLASTRLLGPAAACRGPAAGDHRQHGRRDQRDAGRASRRTRSARRRSRARSRTGRRTSRCRFARCRPRARRWRRCRPGSRPNPNTRTRQFRELGPERHPGARPRPGQRRSHGDAVSVDGELDSARYGGLLDARGAGRRARRRLPARRPLVRQARHPRDPPGRLQAGVLARPARVDGSTTPAVIP